MTGYSTKSLILCFMTFSLAFSTSLWFNQLQTKPNDKFSQTLDFVPLHRAGSPVTPCVWNVLFVRLNLNELDSVGLGADRNERLSLVSHPQRGFISIHGQSGAAPGHMVQTVRP